MRLLILVSAILIGLSLQSMAQTRKYIGYATTSCGSWTNERSKQYSIASLGLEHWALGFVSGSNWTSHGKDELADVDADAIYAWLDNYCRQNPLDKFPHAVTTLAQELANRAARQ